MVWAQTTDKTRALVTIAGFDPTGGAGILADMRTFASSGFKGGAAVTAITSQTASSFNRYIMVDKELLREQLLCIAEAYDVAGVKIGMIGSVRLVGVIRRWLDDLMADRPVPVVLDPVYSASAGGAQLTDDDELVRAREVLFPRVTLVTPNIDEAAILVGRPIESIDDMEAAARHIAKGTGGAVLVKGGHLPEHTDVLVDGDDVHHLPAKKKFPGTFHGTGCVLSSKIVADLASGKPLLDAIKDAKDYLELLGSTCR